MLWEAVIAICVGLILDVVGQVTGKWVPDSTYSPATWTRTKGGDYQYSSEFFDVDERIKSNKIFTIPAWLLTGWGFLRGAYWVVAPVLENSELFTAIERLFTALLAMLALAAYAKILLFITEVINDLRRKKRS